MLEGVGASINLQNMTGGIWKRARGSAARGGPASAVKLITFYVNSNIGFQG